MAISWFLWRHELREFEMPRPIFTGSERTQWAAGIYNNRHTELQMRTDLTKDDQVAAFSRTTGRGPRPTCSFPAGYSGRPELCLL